MHDDIESCVVFGLKDRNLLTSGFADVLSSDGDLKCLVLLQFFRQVELDPTVIARTT